MKPESFKPKSEQFDPLREYSKEVLKLMYPKNGKGKGIKEAMRIVLSKHGVTGFKEVGEWMSKIGEYIKTHADLKRWEDEAVEVPLGKRVETPAKPYVDPEAERKKKIAAANPMFPEYEEDMLQKKARRDFK